MIMAILQVKVIPNAKQTEFSGWHRPGVVKIRLAAPPVDGKANKTLLDFLSAKLKTRKSGIRLKSGSRSREKTIEIDNLEDYQLVETIDRLIEEG